MNAQAYFEQILDELAGSNFTLAQPLSEVGNGAIM